MKKREHLAIGVFFLMYRKKQGVAMKNHTKYIKIRKKGDFHMESREQMLCEFMLIPKAIRKNMSIKEFGKTVKEKYNISLIRNFIILALISYISISSLGKGLNDEITRLTIILCSMCLLGYVLIGFCSQKKFKLGVVIITGEEDKIFIENMIKEYEWCAKLVDHDRYVFTIYFMQEIEDIFSEESVTKIKEEINLQKK